MTDSIVLEGVTKTFGPKVAVRNLDLRVPRGGLYGFIGPNGAGKTTTIRIVMSILFPDGGRVSVLGRESAFEARDRIGYLPEERGIYRKMKAGAFLAYLARLKGAAGGSPRKLSRQWLERLGLAEAEHKKCEELSKGMQQKLQFAAAVLHEPDLLILDEPFSGLDPVNQHLLRDLVLEQHGRGATIIFSTHVMHQAEQICEHVVMIHDGRKVLDEKLTTIRTRFDPRTILFEPVDPDADLSALAGIPGIGSIHRRNGAREIALEEGTDPAEVMRRIVSGIPTARVELRRPTLEDVFLQLVGAEAGPQPESAAESTGATGGER